MAAIFTVLCHDQKLYDEFITNKQYEARESTIAKYQYNFNYLILPTFSNVRIDKLTAVSIQKWKLLMEEKGLSYNTKKKAFNDFQTALNYAVMMEYIPKNPLSKIGNFKSKVTITQEMTIYTAQDFIKFIGTAKRISEEHQEKQYDLTEWDYYVFFNIAFYTGLRKGEILALKWSDIDGEYLSLKRSISQKLKGGDRETPPKNKSSIRTLQMPINLIKILQEHKERQKQLIHFTDGYRICGGERPIREATAHYKNKLYAAKSGLKKIRIHDFRHSHVSLLANEGINIQEVARRLGHARIEITWNTYSHLYPREEEKAIGVLNKII